MIPMIAGFSTTSALASRAIRTALRSKISHAWLRFPIYDVDAVYQSDHRGVNLVSFALFQQQNKIVDQFEFDQKLFDPVIPELVSLLGRSYDLAGMLGNGLVVLARSVGMQIANPWHKADQWYCSELVMHTMALAGEKFEGEPETYDPVRAWQFCLNAKAAKRIAV
jgi:hypothetical protein